MIAHGNITFWVFVLLRKLGDVDVLRDHQYLKLIDALYFISTVHIILDEDSDSDAETSRRQKSSKCSIVWEVSLVTTSHQAVLGISSVHIYAS